MCDVFAPMPDKLFMMFSLCDGVEQFEQGMGPVMFQLSSPCEDATKVIYCVVVLDVICHPLSEAYIRSD